MMKNDNESLTHTKWRCQYHIVLTAVLAILPFREKGPAAEKTAAGPLGWKNRSGEENPKTLSAMRAGWLLGIKKSDQLTRS